MLLDAACAWPVKSRDADLSCFLQAVRTCMQTGAALSARISSVILIRGLKNKVKEKDDNLPSILDLLTSSCKPLSDPGIKAKMGKYGCKVRQE